MVSWAPTDAKLDGMSLDPQPSRIIPHPPAPTRIQMANGGWKSFTPDKGWWFELQYGSEQIADGDPILDVMALFASGDPDGIEFSYRNADGNTITKFVYLDTEIAPTIRWGDNPETYMIPIYECATEPAGS